MSRPARRAPHRLLVLAAALAALVAIAAVSGVGLAASDGADEPIRLDYHAGRGCPAQGEFMTRVRARTARVRLVAEGEHARTFTVKLSGGARPSGSVAVTDGVRSEGTRSLDADTCAEVADALALMVALALDPRALSPAPSTSSTAEASPLDSGLDSATELDAGAEALDSGQDAPDSSPPPAPSLPVPPTLSVAGSGHDASPRDPHFFAGADFAVATGVTPSTLFAGAPYVGWRSTAPALLGVSVHVAFLRAGTGTLGVANTDGAEASFTWTVGRLDGCGMLWPDRRLRLGGCGRLEAGVLTAAGEGSALLSAQSTDAPWFAVGALARLEWSFLGPFVLDAGLGPQIRITTDPFYFRPTSAATLAYQVPLLGFSAEAGLGIHFL